MLPNDGDDPAPDLGINALFQIPRIDFRHSDEFVNTD